MLTFTHRQDESILTPFSHTWLKRCASAGVWMWRWHVRQTDIAIVGGGAAGSTAAAMLGRAGIDTVLIDPHPTYPADFRCEKLDASQAALLHRAGLADAVLPAATVDNELWIA